MNSGYLEPAPKHLTNELSLKIGQWAHICKIMVPSGKSKYYDTAQAFLARKSQYSQSLVQKSILSDNHCRTK